MASTNESKFGSLYDPNGYNGFIPSEHYLTSVWIEWVQERSVTRLDKLVTGVDGEVSLLK